MVLLSNYLLALCTKSGLYEPYLEKLWNERQKADKNKCVHGRQKYRCVDCGGKGICEHKQRRHRCVQCKGSTICQHNKRKQRCPTCNPDGHLVSIMRSRVYGVLKNQGMIKKDRTMEYIGCTIKELREHIEKQFIHAMSWDNIGEWHVDHIKPLLYRGEGTVDHKCILERLHYTNLQPLWALDNISKGNRFIG